MTSKDWTLEYPVKRIKPVDGMAVTAAIWEKAHDYHRHVQHFHNLLSHGPGILTGLAVIASDPADTFVNVLPGIAIGVHGEVIVIKEPIAYDMGVAQGRLRLLLTYGEGPPRAEQDPDQDEDILYVRGEFGMEALPASSTGHGLEIARIHRQGRAAPISDAPDPECPLPNEIDLRFRREVGGAPTAAASMAVCHVGKKPQEEHGRGAKILGQAIRHTGQSALWVDDNMTIEAELDHYTLIYLVGEGNFKLSAEERGILQTFVEQGGTIFMESCHHGSADKEPAADAAFLDLANALGSKLQPVRPGHPLLTQPNFFAALPDSAAAGEGPGLLEGDGIVFSRYDYGCLWQGAYQGGAASREAIRAAHEWGQNLVAYALHRRERKDRAENES